MEITIKINGRFVSVEVSAEVADYLEQAKRNNRKLYRERQRYWDGRECDEYMQEILTSGQCGQSFAPGRAAPGPGRLVSHGRHRGAALPAPTLG